MGKENIKECFGVVLRNDTLFVVEGNYDFTLYDWQGKYLGKRFQPKIRHTVNFFLVPNTDLFLGHVDNFTGQRKFGLSFSGTQQPSKRFRLRKNSNRHHQWSYIASLLK